MWDVFNPLFFKLLIWILSLSLSLSLSGHLYDGHQTGILNYSIFPLHFTSIPGHLPMDKSTVALFSVDTSP
jgi:hypothetical protein